MSEIKIVIRSDTRIEKINAAHERSKARRLAKIAEAAERASDEETLTLLGNLDAEVRSENVQKWIMDSFKQLIMAEERGEKVRQLKVEAEARAKQVLRDHADEMEGL